jgi:L-alanine-DL-glutamate epimerase-like enolase superfamily enzyme
MCRCVLMLAEWDSANMCSISPCLTLWLSPELWMNRVIEYVDHLHEHFLDPVQIENGRYMPPVKPGYSIQMYPQSLADYQYPDGKIWNE